MEPNQPIRPSPPQPVTWRCKTGCCGPRMGTDSDCRPTPPGVGLRGMIEGPAQQQAPQSESETFQSRFDGVLNRFKERLREIYADDSLMR